MGKIIRRTVTITITESLTIVWAAEQAEGDSMEEEAGVLLSPVEIAQLLRKEFGLSSEATNESRYPIQVVVE